MKYEFIRVATATGEKTINRNNIGLIENAVVGSKITLNIQDKSGKNIEILTSDSQQAIVTLLSKM